jgi:4-azaleucine resistance transporter AzlC
VTATADEARDAHPAEASYRDGFRAGLPLGVPTALIGIAFGVLAAPVLGDVATIVMSLVVYAGSAQFTALSVLAGGGGAGTAVLSGLLMNSRFLPMGVALAPWLSGGRLRRALKGQAIVDASWAIANRGDGRFDPKLLIGASLPQFAGWTTGTALGALGGNAIPDPSALGLDAVFPAFFLCLLVEELRAPRDRTAALLGALLALALLPWAPIGAPILAAALGALIGLRR